MKNEVTLGALLHDFGKIVRRSKEENLKHPEVGYNFLKHEKYNLNKNILNCIRYHHEAELKSAKLKEDSIAYIVCLADNIASGIDRRENSEIDKTYSNNEMSSLCSVFNQLYPEQNGKYENKQLDIVKIGYESILKYTKNSKLTYGEYINLKQEFESLYSKNNFFDSINSTIKILEGISSYIPAASYKTYPDISLYDHSKITSAIARSMYEYFLSNDITNFKKVCLTNKKDYYDTNMYILVSGDISGIQNFINRIVSKNALKALRGRSFYLEILTEHFIDEFLEKLELNRSHVLYSGGGHFYLFLPNTKEAILAISNLEEKMNDFLLEKFKTSLCMTIDYEEISANNLLSLNNKSLNEIFVNLSKKISNKKMNRYSNKQLELLFNPDSKINKVDNKRECSICKTAFHLVEKDDLLICKMCNDLIKLGSNIPKLVEKENYHNFINISNKYTSESIELPNFDNIKNYLSFETFSKKYKLESSKRLYSINKSVISENSSINLYLGKYSYENELSLIIKREIGINRIGVLRCDVDNLGNAFTFGFENINSNNNEERFKYVTLSRTATLSKNLNLFFKYEINNICEKPDFYLPNNKISTKNSKRKIIIVYAGGDDVFALGEWEDIIGFSIDLNNNFKKFTNNKMTLSAGIGIFKDKFPVSKMSDITAILESNSKNNENCDGRKKDSITLFQNNDDSTFYWEEIEHISEKMKFIYEQCNVSDDTENNHKLNLSTNYIYNIINLLDKIQNNQNDIYLLAYLIAKHEPLKKETQKLERYYKFRENIYDWCHSKSEIKYLKMALILIIYQNRKEGK